VSEEDRVSPPTHQWLDNFEVLPENIQSPESPVSKVKLLMETSGNFRFLIHVRPQAGIVLEAATLMIRAAGEKRIASVFSLRLFPPHPETGIIEITGLIEKEILFRAFVELSVRDEHHRTSQSLFIEFDQWYGK
jgi:hypothetical protein